MNWQDKYYARGRLGVGRGRLCDPHITEELLSKHFGDLAAEVKEDYLEDHYPLRYRFKPKYRSYVPPS